MALGRSAYDDTIVLTCNVDDSVSSLIVSTLCHEYVSWSTVTLPMFV